MKKLWTFAAMLLCGSALAAPLPSTLLPEGPISTSGSQMVSRDGKPVRLACVGWNQIRTSNPTIEAQVLMMVQSGFNCIRLSWVNATMADDMKTIDMIARAAAPVGLRLILDNHTNEVGTEADWWGAQQKNGLWFDVGPGSDGTNGAGVRGTVTDQRFTEDWVTVAKRYAGNPVVIGYDIRNEPLAYNGQCTWGDGGVRDIRAMYQRVGNAVLAVDADKLIIAEGPQNHGSSFAGTGPAPWGDLTGVRRAPVVLIRKDKLVYSVHDYPAYIGGFRPDAGPAKVKMMDNAWGYLVRENIAPVWMGEMGCGCDGEIRTENAEESKAWADTLVSYMNGSGAGALPIPPGGEGVGSVWWAWGHLNGQLPNGTLESDWKNARPAQAVIYTLLHQRGAGGYQDTSAWSRTVGTLAAQALPAAPVPEIKKPVSMPLTPGMRSAIDNGKNILRGEKR